MEQSWAPSYPALAAWLNGTIEDHLIVRLSKDREEFNRLAAPHEVIITNLEAGAPLRLSGHRKSFRTNIQQFLDIRVVLNAAYHVALAAMAARSGLSWHTPSTSKPQSSLTTTATGLIVWVAAYHLRPFGQSEASLEP